MHKLYELKDTLCNQLEEYADKDLTAGSLDVVDKLSHAIKNLDKIIEKYEDEEYSNDDSYRGTSYRRNGMSYARGRNARRDSMGRYSREGGYSYAAEMDGIMDDLRGLMADMPADKQRRVEALMDELRR